MSEEIKLLGSNKEWMIAKAGDCFRYQPCVLCNKCMVKASHLNMRCGDCEVPMCVHSYKERAMMIKRENFIIDNPSLELINSIEIAKEQCKCSQ